MTAPIFPNYLGKRPRHYAADIIALPTRDARLAAFPEVPEPYRDWVMELVRDYFLKRHFLQRYRHAQSQRRFSAR
ncbi:MAG: hypothetical protein ACXWTY_00655 [Methylobacter sp.]